MSFFIFIPVVATALYVPLLFVISSSRPWQNRHVLFMFFLIPAMFWSAADYIFRANLFPENQLLILKIIMILLPVMAIQLHLFASSYFPPGKSRWLVFAYASLAVMVAAVVTDLVVDKIVVDGTKLYPHYRYGLLLIAAPLLTLAARTLYVLWKKLKSLNSPLIYNQTFSLILGIVVLVAFVVVAILPWGREYPIPHIGNIFTAFMLSYAVIRHQLVDIKIVLRVGATWVGLSILGVAGFWFLLLLLHTIFDFQLDLMASVAATGVALVISVGVFKLRGHFFELMSRAFQGSSYDYHQKLKEFTSEIHNVFTLKEQGGELLSLLIKAINVKEACLLFPEAAGEDWITQFIEPKDDQGKLIHFKLRAGNPVIRYLEKEQKHILKENLSIQPAFLGLWPKEKDEIASKEISIFVPLISRERLIAILVLGGKRRGRFTLEELSVIEDVTARVAVSMEKEYLREQLREREEELSVINKSSAILSSSLDIQETFGTFIDEVKRVVEVDWATIVMLDEKDFLVMALSSGKGTDYQLGERVPAEGTGTGWVVTQKQTFIENDLSLGTYFKTGANHYQKGLRTVVYLPLIAKGKAIGSFIVASKQPNAYTHRHIKLLEHLASQIAMPLENSQLYARAEQKARIDELTGLLNRRSLDEMIDSEISRHSRYGGTFSLAILDLDSFKAYNDTYGHPAGDKLLQKVGAVIKSAIRNADHAFRYGGDEFAVLLPQTPVDDAVQVAERVRKKIAENLNTGEVRVTASIGLASWPDDGISHTDIFAAADATLYRAKRAGGNQSYRTRSARQLQDGSVENREIDIRVSNLVRGLVEALENRNFYSLNHSKLVTELSLSMGQALKLDPADINRLEVCSLLHDIGKISISETIINKPGKLTLEEWEMMKTHTRLGADFAGRVPYLACCADVILHHHERFDGQGYPDGLKGEEIPLEGRILAVADAYAAMTMERSYSGVLAHEQAIEELKKCAGTQFDPALVELFLSLNASSNIGIIKKARR